MYTASEYHFPIVKVYSEHHSVRVFQQSVAKDKEQQQSGIMQRLLDTFNINCPVNAKEMSQTYTSTKLFMLLLSLFVCSV